MGYRYIPSQAFWLCPSRKEFYMVSLLAKDAYPTGTVKTSYGLLGSQCELHSSQIRASLLRLQSYGLLTFESLPRKLLITFVDYPKGEAL